MHAYDEDLSRPQAKYFLYYPSVLTVAALLLWIYPTNLVTGISTGIATVIACLMMWEYLFLNQVVRLSNVCAMGLTVGYGAGTFNSWVTLSLGRFPLAESVSQTVPEMANGVAAALIGCAFLMLVGELFEKPILKMTQRLTMTRGVKYVIFINSAIIVAAAAAGKFHQGGIKTAGIYHAGVLAVFLSFLVSPTAILATIAFLVEREKSQKYLFGGMTVFLWLLELTQGRRDLVYPALVTIGLARFFGYRWSQLSWSRIILTGLAISFLFFGVLTYQLMRLAGDAASSRSLGRESQQVGHWVQEGRAWKIATASSIKNVKTRTLVIVFLSDILYREQTAAPALGKDLLLQVELATPSLLLRNKPHMAEEGLASRTFHVFYPDESNSLFTAGALDFGLWGVLLYPILTILIFSYFLRLLMTYFSFEIYVFAIALFVLTAIAAEGQLNVYFGVMRDMLTFAVFLYLVSKLPIFRWQSED